MIGTSKRRKTSAGRDDRDLQEAEYKRSMVTVRRHERRIVVTRGGKTDELNV